MSKIARKELKKIKIITSTILKKLHIRFKIVEEVSFYFLVYYFLSVNSYSVVAG